MKYFVGVLMVIVMSCQNKKSSETANDTIVQADSLATTGFINRMDDALDAIISRDAKIEVLAEGFDWSEGPLWVESQQFLLFSDIPPNTVFKWDPVNGLEEYLQPSGYTDTLQRGGEVGSNGLLLDNQDNLILCQHGDRRLAMMKSDLQDPQPTYQTIVDNYQGKRLNSPNDAIFSTTGDLYFTDPPYGLEHNVDDPAKELDFQGVYRLDKEGTLHLLTDKLSRPNGIALSPDQNKLYVANSHPDQAIWMEYQISPDGTMDEGRVFYDATEKVPTTKGLPDGLKVHPSGTIFATGPGGVWVFDPSGKHLGTINTGQATSNCALGNNNSYLYITADMYLLRVKLL
ncbi:MAG: SMP-30/gluconolactonase/LRE family protein [Cyclobacteriaceae bacterium]|nr:SMP-30/gluconolactonase/LRE family protein [Cyclobacteriaceae bacterium]